MHTQLADLTLFYFESHRHYHTLSHIASMLEEGKKYSLTEDQILAIWFHDVIYDTRSSNNEKQSAKFAGVWLESVQYPTDGIERVCQIILDTKSHEPSIEASSLVLDLDLAILAAPRHLYVEYSTAIRKEYSWVPANEYRAARIKFLEKMLSRKVLFNTQQFQNKEQLARTNIASEIAVLRENLNYGGN